MKVVCGEKVEPSANRGEPGRAGDALERHQRSRAALGAVRGPQLGPAARLRAEPEDRLPRKLHDRGEDLGKARHRARGDQRPGTPRGAVGAPQAAAGDEIAQAAGGREQRRRRERVAGEGPAIDAQVEEGRGSAGGTVGGEERLVLSRAGEEEQLPGEGESLLDDELDRNTYTAATDTVAETVATFDRNVARAQEVLRALSEEQLLASWRYRYGERVVFELPRLVVIRTTALNHLIHHRGQLSVYLRMLDVPLPSVYGPTADES